MKNSSLIRCVALASAIILNFQTVNAETTDPGKPVFPKQEPGLWENLVSNSISHSIRTFQLCATDDPSSRAKMESYLDGVRTSGMMEGQTISNKKVTATSLSYDFVRSSGVLLGNGSHEMSIPDSKHRTVRNTFKGTMNGQAVSTDETTTSTWIKADCGDVKPIDLDNLPKLPNVR